MSRATAAVFLAVALTVLAPRARAETPRSVAVVEFRSGSSAAPEIGARLARMLTVKTGLAIMAPRAAQQLYGARLDADVKACGDDASCVARLGGKLGVDEVILVGLSELGDVILTMQRVSVATATVEGTLAETLSPDREPGDDQLETYLRQILPANDFEQYGRIRIESNVSAANVNIGGKKRGVTPLSPVTVSAPGNYEVAVTKSGYSDFRASIAVTPNALIVVRPELSALPRDAWYKKWWVVAIAGAVTVGAVSTAIVLSRDGAGDVPVVVEPFSF